MGTIMLDTATVTKAFGSLSDGSRRVYDATSAGAKVAYDATSAGAKVAYDATSAGVKVAYDATSAGVKVAYDATCDGAYNGVKQVNENKVVAGALLGGTTAVCAAPFILGSVGFTGIGIAAKSY